MRQRVVFMHTTVMSTITLTKQTNLNPLQMVVGQINHRDVVTAALQLRSQR